MKTVVLAGTLRETTFHSSLLDENEKEKSHFFLCGWVVLSFGASEMVKFVARTLGPDSAPDSQTWTDKYVEDSFFTTRMAQRSC